MTEHLVHRHFDRMFDVRDGVLGVEYSDDTGERCVLTLIRPHEEPRSWEISRQLTQEELDSLPHGAKVIILWATGGGPWEYELRKQAGRMYAGYVEYPIGNVGFELGRTMVWLIE